MTTVYRGMCAWCFRSFKSSRAGISQRHGWVEVSAADVGKFMMKTGGRHAGMYGLVTHSGDCEGMPFPPYELSCEGTKARLDFERRCLAAAERELERLATRPAFVEEREYGLAFASRDWRDKTVAKYAVKLVSGDDFHVVEGEPWNKHHFTYNRVLERHIHGAESARAFRLDNIALCERMIAEWKLAELHAFEARKATVHFKREGARMVYCGSRSYGLHSSAERSEVTCSRCKRALEGADKYEAAKAATAARGEKLRAWLAEHGPATPKQIKEALGFDQRALNSAVEAAGRSIERNYDPTTYEAKAVP